MPDIIWYLVFLFSIMVLIIGGLFCGANLLEKRRLKKKALDEATCEAANKEFEKNTKLAELNTSSEQRIEIFENLNKTYIDYCMILKNFAIQNTTDWKDSTIGLCRKKHVNCIRGYLIDFSMRCYFDDLISIKCDDNQVIIDRMKSLLAGLEYMKKNDDNFEIVRDSCIYITHCGQNLFHLYSFFGSKLQKSSDETTKKAGNELQQIALMFPGKFDGSIIESVWFDIENRRNNGVFEWGLFTVLFGKYIHYFRMYLQRMDVFYSEAERGK